MNTQHAMWDYNVWHEEGRSADDLDAWAYDLDEARRIAADYLARTGVTPVITRYLLRKTPDGWEMVGDAQEVLRLMVGQTHIQETQQ